MIIAIKRMDKATKIMIVVTMIFLIGFSISLGGYIKQLPYNRVKISERNTEYINLTCRFYFEIDYKDNIRKEMKESFKFDIIATDNGTTITANYNVVLMKVSIPRENNIGLYVNDVKIDEIKYDEGVEINKTFDFVIKSPIRKMINESIVNIFDINTYISFINTPVEPRETLWIMMLVPFTVGFLVSVFISTVFVLTADDLEYNKRYVIIEVFIGSSRDYKVRKKEAKERDESNGYSI